MKRYLILVAAVIMQICLGATYSWSIYVQPIRELTGILQGSAQLPFTLFYFAFPATMIMAGQFLSRLGPRRCGVLGGALFGSGWRLDLPSMPISRISIPVIRPARVLRPWPCSP